MTLASGFTAIISGIVLLFMAIPKLTDAYEGISPVSSHVVTYGMRSVTLKWKYTIEKGAQLSILLCGYRRKFDKKTTFLIYKVENAPLKVGSDVRPPFTGRIRPFEENTTIGMTIDKVRSTDPTTYYCKMAGEFADRESNPLTLTVWDASKVFSAVSNPVIVNGWQPAALKWMYIIPKATKNATFFCGYWNKLAKKMVYLFHKIGNQPLQVDKDFPPLFKGRLKPFEDNYTIGMMIDRTRDPDEGKYFCTLDHGNGKSHSDPVTLIVRDNKVWFRITKQVYRYLYNDATMRWRYTIPKGSQLALLWCGYWRRKIVNGQRIQKVLYIQRPGEPYPEMYNTIDDPFPEWMVGRISFYWKNNTVGIVLEKVMKRDERDYYCYLEYKKGKERIGYFSDSVQLRIFDPMLPATEREKDLLTEVDLSDIDKRNFN